METQHTIPQVSTAEATPSTPHFDNPHLGESPGLPATAPQSHDCIPKPEPPPTHGLLEYSIGLLTGAALALILKCLADDTTPSTNEED